MSRKTTAETTTMYPTVDLAEIDPALRPQTQERRNKAIPHVSCIESHFPAPTFDDLLTEDLLYLKRGETTTNSESRNPFDNWVENKFSYSDLKVPGCTSQEIILSPDETPVVSPIDSEGGVMSPPNEQVTNLDKDAVKSGGQTWERTAFLDLKAYYEGRGVDIDRFGVLYGVHPHIAWHFYKAPSKAALHVIGAHASITRLLESLDPERMSRIAPDFIGALENTFSRFCDGLTRHYLHSLKPVPQGFFACLCRDFWDAYDMVRVELANLGMQGKRV